jgi:hypothetical protein
MENPFKIDDLGVPPFWETSKWIFKILIAHNSWKIVKIQTQICRENKHINLFHDILNDSVFRQCEISKGYIV